MSPGTVLPMAGLLQGWEDSGLMYFLSVMPTGMQVSLPFESVLSSSSQAALTLVKASISLLYVPWKSLLCNSCVSN